VRVNPGDGVSRGGEAAAVRSRSTFTSWPSGRPAIDSNGRLQDILGLGNRTVGEVSRSALFGKRSEVEDSHARYANIGTG
jgi:hypothetical protein